MPRVDFSSPTYPYERVINANQLKGAEKIPYKLLVYLMDLPDANGYTPPDDNDYPRCRLKKYLWHDGANPLAKPMPTAQEVRSLLFDPDEPDINDDEQKKRHPKGYRLFPQRMVAQSNLDAKSMIKIYPGRVLDESEFRTIIGIQIEIWTSYALVSNTRTTAFDRTFDIEQCLRESLAGVNIDGVGTLHASRQFGSYNGSEILYADSGTFVGRMLYFNVLWSDSDGGTVSSC